MALSPLTPVDDTATTAVSPLKTYALDIDNGVLGGYVDGKDAIKQFAYKAIKTARFRFAIYDDDYGCELDDIIGQDVSTELLETEIPRVIKEALIYNELIDDVRDFILTRDGDRLYVSFFIDVNDDSIPMEVTI
ncbi:DUF2634 domain-containing protein [Paenibacillus sediminis]|uniref:DUF2634 domain-containing protein n=1 Tax=Paenibacillus sediminis TaxID=664909 RepID=A0ABS4H6P2_9BACL|nr:DUF2634 domain-containing protein [Paenibacillus sediminis]MBP1938203.1 hypothetical protein [Paenibacillus sediminis]